jgi:hypothetical protein
MNEEISDIEKKSQHNSIIDSIDFNILTNLSAKQEDSNLSTDDQQPPLHGRMLIEDLY